MCYNSLLENLRDDGEEQYTNNSIKDSGGLRGIEMRAGNNRWIERTGGVNEQFVPSSLSGPIFGCASKRLHIIEELL